MFGKDIVLEGASVHRLKTYVTERVKESKRIAESTVSDSLRNAHYWSAKVGEDILKEIEILQNE